MYYFNDQNKTKNKTKKKFFCLYYDCSNRRQFYLIRNAWLVIGAQDIHDTLGRSYWHSTLLNDNFVSRRDFCDHSCSTLHVFQVRRSSFTIAKGFCWRVHWDEYEISLFNSCVDIGGKEQIFSTTFVHHFVQAWLIYRQLLWIPLSYSLLTFIDDGYLNLRAFQCNNTTCWSAYIAGSDAANFSNSCHFDQL